MIIILEGAKNVRIQVGTLLLLQNMTLDEYTNMQTNSTEDQLLESNATALAYLPGRNSIYHSWAKNYASLDNKER